MKIALYHLITQFMNKFSISAHKQNIIHYLSTAIQ